MSSLNVKLISVTKLGSQAAGCIPACETRDFATLYDIWFEQVARWLKALGAPEGDHEDLAQEVFLVVRRRLPEFHGSASAAPALPWPTVSYESEPVPQVALAPAAPTEAHRGEPEHVEPAAKPSTPSEAALVYGAAKALRNNGDAALAAKLLADYARRYPRGALAEEALALSIDVSLARGDGRTKQLATRYLARYPNGHFQVKAQGVLAP